MDIRFRTAAIGMYGILAVVLFAETNAAVITENGSFSDVVSVADGSSLTDDIEVPPFPPGLGVLTGTSVTITTDATFTGTANVPSLFPGGVNSSATTTANYNLSSYGLGSISQPLYVQDTCPGPCQGMSTIATFSQSQTNTVNGANPSSLGGTIPVTITSAQKSFGGTITGTQSITGTASATFTYQPIPTFSERISNSWVDDGSSKGNFISRMFSPNLVGLSNLSALAHLGGRLIHKRPVALNIVTR